MVHVTFETADGQSYELDVKADRTLMEVAKAHDIPGIDADCGGAMACGTCHVVIDPIWTTKLPLQSTNELEMLEYVPNPQPNTRLSCQIPLTDALDGLRVRVPTLQR